jgi:hypothetical protein
MLNIGKARNTITKKEQNHNENSEEEIVVFGEAVSRKH